MKRFQPGYADVEIDRATLAQLPENSEVSDQIAVHEMPAVDEDIDLTNLQLTRKRSAKSPPFPTC